MDIKLGIIGAGDLGQLIAHHAITDNHVKEVFFFDDTKEINSIQNYGKVLGPISSIESNYKLGSFDQLIVGIGYNHIQFRKSMFENFCNKIPFANIVHSSAYIDKSCNLGKGNFILPGCVLDMNVTLLNNILLNTSCTIAHDSIIGNHTFLSPRVAIAGFVNIEECCNIGINSTIIDNINICKHVQTGGGSVVTKNINESGLYVGIPAKKIK